MSDNLKDLQNHSQRLGLKKWVKQSNVIDDTYNANPDSMKAAINVLCQFQGRKIAIFEIWLN